VLASLDKDKPESSWLSLALIRKWDGTMELIENYMPVGSLVGERYEVIGVLGSGGFSYVLRAHDRQEDRTVALKVLDVLGLKQGRRYDELLARFEREIELIEQLQHRNVLSIYGHGFHETPRIPYMVVEFLDGQDLGQYIREHGGFSATRLWPMLFPMLDALAMAGFGGPEAADVLRMIDELGRLEHAADIVQDDLARRLFSIEDRIKPGSLLIWNKIFNKVGDMANHAERMGNRTRLFMAS